MIILLRRGTEAARVQASLQALGLWTVVERSARDAGSAALRVLPASARADAEAVLEVEGVQDVLETPSPHPRVDAQAGQALVLADGVRLGPGAPTLVMAGPCAAESEAQARAAAALVAAGGARVLRGGAFKPRTSPYAFQGAGTPGLRWLREAADAEGLLVVTEALSELDAPEVAEVADLVQIGARNMQNFALLRAVGETGATVLLKRGPAATLEEWLLAGEHLLGAGAKGVAFCERGVRGFDAITRHTLDLSAAALLAAQGQPVVVDPSHAAGRRDLVAPLARAALGAGAHGLLIEVHPDPASARSDGPQALDAALWRALARSLDLGAPCGMEEEARA